MCLATSGPGGIHLLNGLYDAKLDGQPVLAITGLQFHDLIGTHTQQDVALDRLFMDVASTTNASWARRTPKTSPELACRTALARRGVAHITIPVDIQDQPVNKDLRSMRNKPNHVSDVFPRGARKPDRAELCKPPPILNDGKKVAILAGQGALQAGEQLETGRRDTRVLPSSRRSWKILRARLTALTQPAASGFSERLPSEEAMENCDTLLIVGSTSALHRVLSKTGSGKRNACKSTLTPLASACAIPPTLPRRRQRSRPSNRVPHLKQKDSRSSKKRRRA